MQTKIQSVCILLASETDTFHLRAHQLSNWESDGMWEVQESQQGLNLANHRDLIEAQSRSLPELTHADPCLNTHFLHLHPPTLLHNVRHTHNDAHTVPEKTLTLSHTWKNTICPLQSHLAHFKLATARRHRDHAEISVHYRFSSLVMTHHFCLSPLCGGSFYRLHLYWRFFLAYGDQMLLQLNSALLPIRPQPTGPSAAP